MKDGKSQSRIAQLLDRHKSTISRELARNTGLKEYRPKQACWQKSGLWARAMPLKSSN